MDKLYEEVQEPVSPHGQCFNSSAICSYIFGFLEFAIPFDNSLVIPLFKDVFLPINPHFSSIMVRDEDGKMRWQKVEVNVEEHVKIPIFPETKNSSSHELYDNHVSDYVTSIIMERTPQEKPLWEIHLINYPTTNAASTMIFKLHHALGDGYSLTGALLSCLQRADDPSLPLSFPKRKSSQLLSPKKGFFKWLPSTMFSFFNTMSDLGWSILKSSIIKDDKTPIWNAEEGVEFLPCVVSNLSFSLDEIKIIKSKLEVTINDVITGVVFYGIRLYMQEIDNKAKTSNSTGLVVLNTRNIGSYRSIQDMMKIDSKSPWGNHISFIHVPIPKLSQDSLSNPLEFIWKAQNIIKRKRSTFTVFLIEWLLNMELKLRGHEAYAKHIYDTLRNSSVVISNLIGPVEPMALANHPVKGFYFTMSGGPELYHLMELKDLKLLLRINEEVDKISALNFFELIDMPEDSPFFTTDSFRLSTTSPPG